MMQAPKQAIETGLRDWFKAAADDLRTDEARQLLRFAETVILRAGKRARPRLLFMTYEAYGGLDSQNLLDVALALELHHQFLLIHDDVMDDDLVRYDGHNITGLYMADGLDKATASSMAILAGNLLFSYADQLLLESALSAETKIALLRLLHATNRLVQQGQQLDLTDTSDALETISEAKLLRVNSLKTATYTVHLPMQMAAELLGLPLGERQAIDAFAEAFGVLYQLTDDYSDYFSNVSSMDAHPKFRDFQQGKITYPLWLLLQQADETDRKAIQRLLGHKTLSKDQHDQVDQLFEVYGIPADMAKIVQQAYDDTLAKLSALQPKNGTGALRQLVEQYKI